MRSHFYIRHTCIIRIFAKRFLLFVNFRINLKTWLFLLARARNRAHLQHISASTLLLDLFLEVKLPYYPVFPSVVIIFAIISQRGGNFTSMLPSEQLMVISWLTEDINQRSATSSLSRETAPPTIFSPTRSSELTGKFTLGLLLQMPFSVSNSFRIRFFSDSEKLHALIRNNQIQKMWIIFRNE